MTHCPTLVITGTHSGAGKSSFALASGRPCYNLDGWMAGHDHCRRLFVRATADADYALVEEVMGLFDGADAESAEGSTAVARFRNDAEVHDERYT